MGAEVVQISSEDRKGKTKPQWWLDVAKNLKKYHEFKKALEVSSEPILPSLVPNYDQQNKESQEVLQLRRFIGFLEKHDLPVSTSVAGAYRDFLRAIAPETLNFNSTTERYAFMRIDKEAEESDPEFQKRIMEKQRFVNLIDQVVGCLTPEQQQIIQYEFLLPPAQRITNGEVLAKKIGLSRRDFGRKKNEAMESIATMLNFI